MNIFILAEQIADNAHQLCDKHLLNFLNRELGQMLTTALIDRYNVPADRLPRRADGKPMKPSHRNHPCTRWVCSGDAQFAYTFAYWQAILAEYDHRFPFNNATWAKQEIPRLAELMAELGIAPWQDNMASLVLPIPLAMPNWVVQIALGKTEKLAHSWQDAVQAYREYYKHCKVDLAYWRASEVPHWWADADKLAELGIVNGQLFCKWSAPKHAIHQADCFIGIIGEGDEPEADEQDEEATEPKQQAMPDWQPIAKKRAKKAPKAPAEPIVLPDRTMSAQQIVDEISRQLDGKKVPRVSTAQGWLENMAESEADIIRLYVEYWQPRLEGK